MSNGTLRVGIIGLGAIGRALMHCLHEADSAYLFSRQYLAHNGSFLWLCLTNREAERVAEDLSFFLPPRQKDRVVVVPGAETDPYRGLSPHPEILENRAAALWRILPGFEGFVVTSLSEQKENLQHTYMQSVALHQSREEA